MISRQNQTGDTASTALYSACLRYRYLLIRSWSDQGEQALFIMLNPSTATEMQNDPTIERCERRARAWGYGGFSVVNLFAFRATDPKMMRAMADPIGQDGDAMIVHCAQRAGLILCGWGNHGALLNRGAAVEHRLRGAGLPLFHLGVTLAGHPVHPLYIAYTRQPERWA